jgi:hypothetical protein
MTFVPLEERVHFGIGKQIALAAAEKIIEAEPIAHVPEEEVELVFRELMGAPYLLHVSPLGRRVADVEYSDLMRLGHWGRSGLWVRVSW